jgi:uncharacterized membrane protein
LPDFDPTSNGHRLVKSSDRTESRNSGGVLLVAIVSALTGLSLLMGATAGALIAAVLGLKGQTFITPVVVASGLAAGVGVWVGIRVFDRFVTRSRPGRGQVWPTVGGVVGLVAAVAIASKGLGPLAPIIVILLPGLGALLGERASQRRAARQRTLNSSREVGEDLKGAPRSSDG